MSTENPLVARYEGMHCTLAIEQYATGVVVVRISGVDVGEFGDAPMADLGEWIGGAGPIRLFIDAREVLGASIDVSGAWARWLAAHKAHFQDVTMLAGTRFIEITADFVRRVSDLEGVMRVYTDADAFDAAVGAAIDGAPEGR